MSACKRLGNKCADIGAEHHRDQNGKNHAHTLKLTDLALRRKVAHSGVQDDHHQAVTAEHERGKQRKRLRKKPEFKGMHITLSFGQDGTDRVIFTLPNGQREELRTLLMEDVLRLTSYLEEQGW